MSFRRKLLLGLVTAGMLAGCTGGKLTMKTGERILFFGDSITEQGVKPAGYVTLIREDLSTRYPDLAIEVVGAGVSGNKVPDLQNRLSRDVIEKKPSVVVIYIGINDVWHWKLNNLKGTTEQQYEGGLREIIARIGYSGSEVILCTPSVIGEIPDSTYGQNPMLNQYAAISRKIAKDVGIRLCDLHKAFDTYLMANNPDKKEKGILTTDGVHLNDEGNKFVAKEILRFF
jgi:isoamyl acetate esterase